jgi:hypothetical protein
VTALFAAFPRCLMRPIGAKVDSARTACTVGYQVTVACLLFAQLMQSGCKVEPLSHDAFPRCQDLNVWALLLLLLPAAVFSNMCVPVMIRQCDTPLLLLCCCCCRHVQRGPEPQAVPALPHSLHHALGEGQQLQPLRDQAGMVSQLVCCCRCCWLWRQR